MDRRESVSKSVWDKHLEIHYNEFLTENKTRIQLKGNIRCPVLNEKVSSLVCKKLMDLYGWPRYLRKDICAQCNCNMKEQLLQRETIKNKA